MRAGVAASILAIAALSFATGVWKPLATDGERGGRKGAGEHRDQRALGRKLFLDGCAKCHDENADRVLPDGSSLLRRLQAKEDVRMTVLGRLKRAPDADKRAIAEYLAALVARAKARAEPEPQVLREDFLVEGQPGISLHVREVRRAGKSSKAPVLLVHGGGPAAVASFDLPLAGYSLAADVARAGHLVYLMDVRGWGASTRPHALDEQSEKNPPAVRSEEAVADIAAVVHWIRARNSGRKVALMGWASGGHWCGMFTRRNNDKVSHLVVLNSLYAVDVPWALGKELEAPEQPGKFNPKAGAYRLADEKSLLRRWEQAIPSQDKSEWRDPLVARAYVEAALSSDPTSRTRTPPSLRIPIGYQQDSYELSRGRKYWDATDIRAATLIVRGELDYWSRPEDLTELRRTLVHAPRVRAVTIRGGTHHLFLDRPEKGRNQFLEEILSFLSR